MNETKGENLKNHYVGNPDTPLKNHNGYIIQIEPGLTETGIGNTLTLKKYIALTKSLNRI